MSSEDFEDSGGRSDKLRAARKAERREEQRQHQKEGPVVARYGVWTGEGYLREGESLEKKVAEASLTVDGQSRRDKRRQRKARKSR